jgi:hypothetical protein
VFPSASETLGSVESLFWADWIKSSERLHQVEVANGDPKFEHEPLSGANGCGTSPHRVWRRKEAEILTLQIFLTAGEVTFFSFTCPLPKVGPKCQETRVPPNAGQSPQLLLPPACLLRSNTAYRQIAWGKHQTK